MANVKLRGVVKRFGSNEVIHGIDLDIADKEFVVLVGPSGCGKSTLLRLIAGLEDATEGEIFIGGRCVTSLPPKKRGIAMVFQSYALYPHMTGYDNMAFGLKLSGTDRGTIRERVERAADTLQIRELLNRKPKEMSGGERQRVAIGRAIVRQPEVFLFDEPLSNLDAKLRVQMRIELAELHDHLSATMIYVTHDQVEAMTLADRIVVMRDGVIEQVGAPLDVYHRPANVFVAGFIGSPGMNLMAGTVESIGDDTVEVRIAEDTTVRAPATGDGLARGGAVTLGIRPADLHVGPGDSTLAGQVQSVERLGDVSYAHVRLATGETVTAQASDRNHRGERVTLGFIADACHVFDATGVALPHSAPRGRKASA